LDLSPVRKDLPCGFVGLMLQGGPGVGPGTFYILPEDDKTFFDLVGMTDGAPNFLTLLYK
jgi:hypothetical protein